MQIWTHGKSQNEEDGSLSVGPLGLGEVKGEEAYAREESRRLWFPGANLICTNASLLEKLVTARESSFRTVPSLY
jgi:hypothetical protein